jgi:two-component system LytT family sensor kinase
MEARRGAPPLVILAIVGTCLLMAGLSAADVGLVTTVHGETVPLATVLSATAPRWIVFAALLPLVVQVSLRHPPWPLRPGSFALQLALFMGISLVHAIVHAVASRPMMPFGGAIFGFNLHVARIWVNSMPLVIPIYAATLLTAWSVEQARARRARELRTSQLEAQLQSARLAALRAQLSPHFLYNTLNGIAALVTDRQNGRASDALDQLAELLHAAFHEDGREFITLAEETVLARRYLELQQLRFGDRLTCEVLCSPRAGECLVPPLVLQPLVENAVIHGLANRSTPMLLTVDAWDANGRVTIVIAQDGPELPPNWNPTESGLGLANTRARLASAFGDAASLVVARRPGGGVTATITLPAPSDQKGSKAGADAGAGRDEGAPPRAALQVT